MNALLRTSRAVDGDNTHYARLPLDPWAGDYHQRVLGLEDDGSHHRRRRRVAMVVADHIRRGAGNRNGN